MEKSLQPDGICQLSKADGHVIQVEHESVMLYFRPETEEFICIPDEDAGEFDNHCQDLARRVEEFHQAKVAHTREVNHYTEQLVKPDANPDSLVTAVNTQETKLEEKRQALLEILNDGDTSNMGYKEVVELIPILDTRKGKGKKQTGKRYTYATTGYFSERSGGRSQEGKAKKWHTVTMKQANGAKESIYRVDKKGKRSIDIKKLRKQLGTDMLPKLKAELKDYVNLDDYNVNSTLFDWAESWNEAAFAYTELDCGIEISAAAQFMRFVSNAGASAEFDPNSGMLKADVKYSEKLALVSGIGVTECHIPDKLGWALTYKGEEGAGTNPDAQPPLDMGMLRIWIYNQTTGFLGASAQLEAQLQVVVIDEDKQVVAGQSGGRLPPFKQRYKGQNKPFYDQIKSDEQAASASVEAFVGVKVENLTKGTLQWLKPTPPQNAGNLLPKVAGEFSDLATIGTELGAMAGFGAGAHFRCGFISGKFCFHVSASLCCGSGGKGGFICEVNYQGLQELGTWLATMLFNGSYRYLKLIEEDAFTAFTQLSVLLLGLPGKAIKGMYAELGKAEDALRDLADEFNAFVTSIIQEAVNGFAASDKRNRLAEDILAAPEKLLAFTPESKGILLWLLTRHGTWDHADLANRGGLLWLDIYPRRKQAILAVLHSIQSKREWMKVMCHCDSRGADISVKAGITEETAMKQQQDNLLDFLREGDDLSDKMRRKMGTLNTSGQSNVPLDIRITAAIIEQIYRALKGEQEISIGYALSMNNSYWYNLCRTANSLFPLRCDFTETHTTSGEKL